MGAKTPDETELARYRAYETKLTPQQAAGLPAWAEALGLQQGRTGAQVLRDSYNYDIPGAYMARLRADDRGHVGDTFKKPNHPTFSTDSQYHGVDGNAGGVWSGNPNGTSNFDPGPTNMDHRSEADLRDYWNQAEAPEGHTLRGRR